MNLVGTGLRISSGVTWQSRGYHTSQKIKRHYVSAKIFGHNRRGIPQISRLITKIVSILILVRSNSKIFFFFQKSDVLSEPNNAPPKDLTKKVDVKFEKK